MYKWSSRIKCRVVECFPEKLRWFSIEHICQRMKCKTLSAILLALFETLTSTFLPAAIGKCHADVVFIMDSSASVGLLNWFIMKQFVMDIIRGFNIGRSKIRVGVVHYGTLVVTDFHLKQYYNADEMVEKVWKIPPLAEITNTAGGLKVNALCCSSLRV